MADAPINYGKTRVLHSDQEGREERQIKELEAAMSKVGHEYRLYFNGAVPKAPFMARNQLDNLARWTRHNLPKRTAQRFKMQQILSRYQNLAEHWDRSMRGIEEGEELAWVAISRRIPEEAAVQTDGGSQAKAAASTNNAQASAYLAALTDPSSQEEDVRKIYNSYVAARSKLGEEAGLSFDRFQQVVAKQTSAILAKGAVAVQFRVEIANDKVHLKAKALRD